MIKEMELAVSRDFRGGESILLSVVLSQISTFKMLSFFFDDGAAASDSSREVAMISMVIRVIFVVDEDDKEQ